MSQPTHIREPLFAALENIKNRVDPADEKRMTVFCDGAAEPTNPGPMGCAYVLQDAAGKQIEAKGFYLGEGSNNVAEYTAVIKAAEAAIRLGATRLDVRTDSQLVVKQILGLWVVNADHLRDLRDRAVALLNQIGHWDLEWVPREKNAQADTLANNAVMFKKDLDYSGREILATAHEGRVIGATRDFFRSQGRRRLKQESKRVES